MTLLDYRDKRSRHSLDVQIFLTHPFTFLIGCLILDYSVKCFGHLPRCTVHSVSDGFKAILHYGFSGSLLYEINNLI